MLVGVLTVKTEGPANHMDSIGEKRKEIIQEACSA